jgi:hypothetical protein
MRQVERSQGLNCSAMTSGHWLEIVPGSDARIVDVALATLHPPPAPSPRWRYQSCWCSASQYPHLLPQRSARAADRGRCSGGPACAASLPCGMGPDRGRERDHEAPLSSPQRGRGRNRGDSQEKPSAQRALARRCISCASAACSRAPELIDDETKEGSRAPLPLLNGQGDRGTVDLSRAPKGLRYARKSAPLR